MNRRTLYFLAPRRVELREEPLAAPGAGQVLVETLCSAISAGTEMLIYQDRFPRDVEADSVIPSLRGSFKFPLAYGYACVGIVRETGPGVDLSWRGRTVFAFQPHTSHFVCEPRDIIPVPPDLSPETACFLPSMETAVNLVQDGAPLYGERVLILGQGVVGLLVASLLSEFPLETLAAADRYERRRAACPIPGPACLDPGSATFQEETAALLRGGADLTFELSGNPAALNDALSLTCFSGRIVIGSWYGQKNVEVNLGGTFHRSRIRLISSQVSTIAPELSGRWDKARRFQAAWDALRRLRPETWITHRFPVERAAEAYRLLDENPQDAIQVLLEYST